MENARKDMKEYFALIVKMVMEKLFMVIVKSVIKVIMILQLELLDSFYEF